jgi:anti-sigma regulatory factor (Ser/Thr protein kinase)
MLHGSDAEDDATLLALRWGGTDGAGSAASRVAMEAAATVVPPHAASTKLRPEALASSSARRFLRSLLERWGLLDLTDVAELCVSELVTNAVLHARTPIQLEVRSGAGLLHVDVCDSGGARIDLPPPDQPAEGLESGRGLFIVQALSARTGVTNRRTGTCVWFELDLPLGSEATYSERTDLS